MNKRLAIAFVVFAGSAIAGDLTVDDLTVKDNAYIYEKLQVKSLEPDGPAEGYQVLYYSFQTNGGSTVTDDSGSGHSGTVVGATYNASGYTNGGMYDFDGSDDYIYVADTASLDFGTNNFTATGWIKLDSSNAWAHLSNKRLTGDPAAGWELNICRGTGETSAFSVYDASGADVVAGPHIPLNEWHHLAGVRDGSQIIFYYDGSPYATNSASVRNVDNGAQFRIARSRNATYVNGKIDEVWLFNRVLTAAEIEQIYEDAFTNYPAASLEVTGDAQFIEGVSYLLPLGDISMGSYTNSP